MSALALRPDEKVEVSADDVLREGYGVELPGVLNVSVQTGVEHGLKAAHKEHGLECALVVDGREGLVLEDVQVGIRHLLYCT